MFSFRKFPSTPRKQVWQLYPLFFCSESKNGENLKSVSFKLRFPQKVRLEMMKAKLTTLPNSFEVAKMFQIMCGNDKKLSFSPRGSTFQHFSTGHVKAVWASCQTFFAQNQKQVTFVKVFKKLFSSKSFSGASKIHFWQACRNHFCQTLYYVIAQSLTFVKVFKKLFSSKSFSGRVKFIFDRLVETTFAKRYTTLLLKVRNW